MRTSPLRPSDCCHLGLSVVRPVGSGLRALDHQERARVQGHDLAGVPLAPEPILLPKDLAVSGPDDHAQVAGAGHPLAAVADSEAVDVVADQGRNEAVRQALRQTVEREAPLKLALGPHQVEMVALRALHIEALHGQPVVKRRGLEGEVVPGPLPPAELAALNVECVEVMVPVHRVQDRQFAAVGDDDVADVRSERLVGRREVAGGNVGHGPARPGGRS